MRLTRTIAPAEQPVTREEVKLHCRVDHDDEDDLLTSLIAAASDYLDGPSGVLGRAIIEQEWVLELDAFPSRLVLPIEPVQSVVVKYIDDADVEQTVSGGDIVLINAPSAKTVLEWVDGFSMPSLGASRYPIRITINAGFGSAADTPDAIKVAIKMMVGHWYENREAAVVGMSVVDLPMAVNALLARWRVVL
jgi:uncharacterized phiE125 gp8 family phage protein